jgi:hypothetical protein
MPLNIFHNQTLVCNHATEKNAEFIFYISLTCFSLTQCITQVQLLMFFIFILFDKSRVVVIYQENSQIPYSLE